MSYADDIDRRFSDPNEANASYEAAPKWVKCGTGRWVRRDPIDPDEADELMRERLAEARRLAQPRPTLAQAILRLLGR